MALIFITKPFAGYSDFKACVEANQDKDNPEAYCGRIQAQVERARIYVKDPSKAPPGVSLTKGPRGGLWFDSASVPKRTGYKPTKLPTPKKAPKGKKPAEPKPEKRAIGAPLRGPEDLPTNVQREAPDVQAAYTKLFNDTLAKGGSEADALAAAKEAIPKRGATAEPKAPKPEKRQVGQPFNSFDDPSVPMKVRQESEQVKRDWILTFNVELRKGGSEADAIQAANEKLPDRKKPKPVKAPRTATPKTEESKKSFHYVSKGWDEARQIRDPNGRFAGTTGGGGGGGTTRGGLPADKTPLILGDFDDPSIRQKLGGYQAAHGPGSLMEENPLGLTPDEQGALSSYFQYSFEAVNGPMRDGTAGNDKAATIRGHMLTAMEKARPLPHDATLFRGVNPEVVANLKVGDTFIDRGFISTSSKYDAASARAARTSRYINGRDSMGIAVIKAKKGQKALPGALGEWEAILPPGTHFKVTDKKVYPPLDKHGWDTVTVQLEVIK